MGTGEQKVSKNSIAETLLLNHKLKIPANGCSRPLQGSHLIRLLPAMNSTIFDCA